LSKCLTSGEIKRIDRVHDENSGRRPRKVGPGCGHLLTLATRSLHFNGRNVSRQSSRSVSLASFVLTM
jgi:hypothetical protein